jgi:stage III sporulation protein AD
MTVAETVGVALLCAVSALILRECRSPVAPFLILLGGLLIWMTILPAIEKTWSFALTLTGELPSGVGETVGKVLAVGFLSGAGADVCSELGAPSLATALGFAGKAEILLLALPLLTELLSRAEALLT